jgi:hypothetical protein
MNLSIQKKMRITKPKITIVPDEELPQINWDSPELKTYIEESRKILSSPKVRAQLEKILKRS